MDRVLCRHFQHFRASESLLAASPIIAELAMEIEATGLGGATFAVTSFVASSHPAESCGLNGLPLTPHRSVY